MRVEQKELYDKRSFFEDPFAQIPAEIIEKMESTSLRTVNNFPLDVSHGDSHIFQGLAVISGVLGLDSLSVERLRMSLIGHDLGYKFVKAGILRPEEHALGSVYLSRMLTTDNQVLSAILHHSDDILPVDTPLWARALRDTDRLLLIGYDGLNRISPYWGFTDPQLEGKTLDELVSDGIIVDGNYLNPQSDNEKAKSFFYRRVFPFLKEKGIVKNAIMHCRHMQTLFFGGLPSHLWYVVPDVWTEKRIVEMHDEWAVEPVAAQIAQVFSRKEEELSEILWALRSYEYRDWEYGKGKEIKGNGYTVKDGGVIEFKIGS